MNHLVRKIKSPGEDMPKRWLLWLAMLVVALSCLTCFYPFTPANCAINLDGVQQLRVGINEDEVNKLLGVPPGDYTTGPGHCTNPDFVDLGGRAGSFAPPKTAVWNDDRAQIVVEYDGTGKLLRAFGFKRSRDRPINFIMEFLRYS